ncbi:hypothetical protein AGIG_G18381 [Arapaima gigas]
MLCTGSPEDGVWKAMLYKWKPQKIKPAASRSACLVLPSVFWAPPPHEQLVPFGLRAQKQVKSHACEASSLSIAEST